MPQLNIFSFPTQVFWFILVFLFFYTVFKYFYLKNFAEAFKIRTKLLKLNNTTSKKTVLSISDIILKSIF